MSASANENNAQSGQTPDGYADLRGNGGNPFASGDALPSVTDVETSAWPITAGGVPGYYSNPAPDPVNPWSNGAPGPVGDTPPNLAAGLDAAYAETMRNQRAEYGTDTQPTMADYWTDSGFGADGQGRS